MRIHRLTLYALAAWIVLLIYFAVKDTDALLVSLALTPAIGGLLLLSIRMRHPVLSIFLAFALLSHAVAPPFFFLRREFYSYGGDFGAVKDFNFSVNEFLREYALVVLLLTATLVFCYVLYKLWAHPPAAEVQRFSFGGGLPADEREWYGNALALFLTAVAMPLSLFMYSRQIGITGIEPTVLPFRLTGILTYFRMFAIPLLIFSGYGLSSRRLPLTVLILLYTFVGGFASASRYFVLTIGGPVALFALLERHMRRFVAATVAVGLIFVVVTASRDYVYLRRMPLGELMATTLKGYDVTQTSPFDLVAGITNRLWGPQDVVLAYQYHVPDRFTAIRNYFGNGTVIEDLTYEFYGMKFTEGASGFGVGIGYIAWMIVLADRSLPVLIALAFVTACLLSVSAWVVDGYRGSPLWLWQIAAQPVAFLLVYFMYESSLNWWFDALVLGGVGLIVGRLYEAWTKRVSSGRLSTDGRAPI